jgi:Na+/glutamate symporter
LTLTLSLSLDNTASGGNRTLTKIRGCAEPVFARQVNLAMSNAEISFAISTASFGLVIGFLAGYAVRAYISRHRHRSKY